MDNETIYFVNSQGKTAVLSNSYNTRYWELGNRKGFKAPEISPITQKFASGAVKYLGKELNPRSCSMNMVVKGETSVESDKIFFDMLDVLLDINGEKEGKLYIEKPNVGKVYLNCIYISGMNIIEQYRKFRIFTLEFFGSDPYFYEEGKKHYFKDWSELTIKNNTDCDIAPIMKFSGTINSGAISNTKTGKVITFNNNIIISTNKTLVIDTRENQKNVYLESANGDIENAVSVINWSATDGLDFHISPGSMKLSHEMSGNYSMTENSYLLIQKRYLGV